MEAPPSARRQMAELPIANRLPQPRGDRGCRSAIVQPGVAQGFARFSEAERAPEPEVVPVESVSAGVLVVDLQPFPKSASVPGMGPEELAAIISLRGHMGSWHHAR